MELRERLRRAMEGATGGPLNANQLARKTGITRSNFTHILNGTSKSIQFASAKKIAKATGFRAEWLLDESGPMHEVTRGIETEPANLAKTAPSAEARSAEERIKSLEREVAELKQAREDAGARWKPPPMKDSQRGDKQGAAKARIRSTERSEKKG